MSAYFSSFWLQATALAALVVALHLLGDWRDTGRPPRRWVQWREVIASVVVCVALFALISGGRGCAAGRDDLEEPAEAPHPPGKG